jgi:hypothetical protein
MSVFARFKGGVDGTLGYYESLHRTLQQRWMAIAATLDAVVDRMHGLAGATVRHPLAETAPACEQ